MEKNEKTNLYPIIVRCAVEEEKISFPEIMKYVEKTVGKKVDPNVVFTSLSKLVEYKILKLNADTTGTFSLEEWRLSEQ